MTSTRERAADREPTLVAPDDGSGSASGAAVVRVVVALRRRRVHGVDTAIDELPIAVGFGSLHEVRPSRLRAVPTYPLELVAPGSGGLALAPPDDQPAPGGDARRLPLPSESLSATAVGRPSAAPVRAVPRLSDPAPLRLTARGRAVLLIVAAAVGVAVVVSAWFGAGAGAGATSKPATPPAQVVVHSGDTLWTIAGRIAPDRDPRAVVDQLLRTNHLGTPMLVPGQVLRTH